MVSERRSSRESVQRGRLWNVEGGAPGYVTQTCLKLLIRLLPFWTQGTVSAMSYLLVVSI